MYHFLCDRQCLNATCTKKIHAAYMNLLNCHHNYMLEVKGHLALKDYSVLSSHI